MGASMLNQLAFLIGEWRGTGRFRFLNSNREPISYQVRYMCKYSPNDDGIIIIEFDDDPEAEGMFHASQGFLYVEPKTKEIRFKRNTLMDSARHGLVHLETWKLADDGSTIKISTVENDAVSGYGRNVLIRRVSDSELLKKGEVSEGSERFGYEEKLVRRRSH